MKFNYLSMAVVSMLLGSALAGCSSDSILNDEPQIVDRDMQLFIKVAIADPGNTSTRADNGNNQDSENYFDPKNYTDGSKEEMAINSVLFVFYDAKGIYINSQQVGKDKFTGSEGNGSGNMETTLKIIVPVDLKEGQGMPTSVMAYVNPTPVASGSVDQSFGRALCLKRGLEQIVPSSIVPSTDGKNHTGFTMTNSVYYDTTVPANGPVIAATVPEDALFDDEETAKKDENTSKEITIYVERVVAKVTLTNTADAFTPKPATAADANDANNHIVIDGYTLSFVPVAWAVNNLEKETFLIKNFRSQNTDGTATTEITNLDYTTANDANHMGGLQNPSWNYYLPTQESDLDQINNGHRSFWAFSSTYFNGGKYPETADIYGNGTDFSLYYLCYKTIANGQKGWALKYNNGFSADECIYTLENTMRPSVIADNMGRVMSSATIVGYYTLTKNNTTITDANDKPATFYVSRGNGDATKYKIWEAADMLTAFMGKNSVILVNNGTTEAPDYKPATDKNDFEVIHPSSDVYGNAPLASRHVTLQLKSTAVASGKYYYVNTNGVTVPITTTNINEANFNLYSSLSNEFGMIEGFQNGKAYFNVPIKHLWAKTGNDLGSATLGEYGVVRNHAYNIEITGIQGLGTGVENPEDPIIPNVDKKQYYVRTKIHVQRWRLVPQQSVILK